MKTRKFLSALLAVMACVGIILTSCQKDGSADAQSYKMETNLMKDKKLFAAVLKDRSAANVFEIKEVVRKNEILEVKVKGGGTAESFRFVWDGLIQESYPMGIRLVMQYDNANDDFDAAKELTVVVNLQKILGSQHKVQDFHFNVINGSKMQTVVLNPDGTKSSQSK